MSDYPATCYFCGAERDELLDKDSAIPGMLYECGTVTSDGGDEFYTSRSPGCVLTEREALKSEIKKLTDENARLKHLLAHAIDALNGEVAASDSLMDEAQRIVEEGGRNE